MNKKWPQFKNVRDFTLTYQINIHRRNQMDRNKVDDNKVLSKSHYVYFALQHKSKNTAIYKSSGMPVYHSLCSTVTSPSYITLISLISLMGNF